MRVAFSFKDNAILYLKYKEVSRIIILSIIKNGGHYIPPFFIVLTSSITIRMTL